MAESTHFQGELGCVRGHVAPHLYRVPCTVYRFSGCDNDAVARRLGFHDVPNFRRTFER